MKLHMVGTVGVLLVAAFSVGCGPGLSHRAKAPEQTDVFGTMDSELARSIGMTTLSSAPTVKNAEPLSASQWSAPAPATQTWLVPDPGPDPHDTRPYEGLRVPRDPHDTGPYDGLQAPASEQPAAAAPTAPAVLAAPQASQAQASSLDQHPYD